MCHIYHEDYLVSNDELMVEKMPDVVADDSDLAVRER